MVWGSDKMFFALFLPLSGILMFAIGPMITIVGLQTFFAEDIIPYDFTKQLLLGVESLGKSGYLPGSVSDLLLKDGVPMISKPVFKLKNHLHDIPLFTMDKHFDVADEKDNKLELVIYDNDQKKMIEYIRRLPAKEQRIGYVHHTPIIVSARGVVVHVKSIVEQSNGSFRVIVKQGAAFELESIRNDKKLGFLLGDVEIVPKHKIIFHAGQVMIHKKYGYRGVIISADKICKASEDWILEMKVDSLSQGRNQPFYKILVDVNDRPGNEITYVAHENIQISHGEIEHFQLVDHFLSYDSKKSIYLPRH